MIGFTIVLPQFQPVVQLLQVHRRAVHRHLHPQIHLLHQVPVLTSNVRFGKRDGDLVLHVIPIEKDIADIATGKVAHT